MDAAFSDIALQGIIFGGIEQAEEMHPVFGDGFKSAKGKYPGPTRGLDQTSKVLHPIMVRHRDNFDALLLAGGDDGGVVLRLIRKRGRLAVRPR